MVLNNPGLNPYTIFIALPSLHKHKNNKTNVEIKITVLYFKKLVQRNNG